MKYLICLVVGVFTFVSCDKDNVTDVQSELIGTWKLTQVLADIGNGQGEWNDVEEGYEYTFNSNNTFESNRFTNCSQGNYSLDSDELTLNFDCNTIRIGNETIEDGILIEKITFESDYLRIDPTYTTCVEACGWKFVRLD